MAREAGFGSGFNGRQLFRPRAEDHIGRFGWIILVPRALAVATLAPGCTRVAFHTMLGLVNGKHMSAGIVVTEGAFLIALK